MTTTLQDADARERIEHDTGSTLFVSASAGSGKTRALVDRVATLVLNDGFSLSGVVAVTFTEKAGAELRDRLRARFERAWQSAATNDPVYQRAAAALDDLDAAATGTLHSFAQRILTAHAIEAGLPPLIEVLDEVASGVVFEERWARIRAQLLDDEAVAEPLLLAMSAGVTLDHLRSLARAFGNDWDLIQDRVLPVEPTAGHLPDVHPLAEEAARLVAFRDRCTDESDRFIAKLVDVGAWRRRLAAASDAGARLEVLLELDGFAWRVGNKKNWLVPLQGLRDECAALQTRARRIVSDVLESTLRRLAGWIAERVLESAAERRDGGRLEFHDLLVLARNLLRHDPHVRAVLQQQYPRLLLDEFQDTDPIQIELAVRIAGGAAASAPQWQDVDVPEGSLFVVGDPKQSIYRFRRADIATYLQAQDQVGHPVSLTMNFRAAAPVLWWINTVFDQLIQAEPEAQPAYEALDEWRGAPESGPAVTVLGALPHPGKLRAAELREREAADVAAVIQRAIAEHWAVEDPRTNQWRPVELGDVAILVPARTSLPFLEHALDSAGVPYQAGASSLVHQAGEVRDLLAAVRAVADPSDGLALVTALRSPLFGCGDDDLWTWKQAGGLFTILAPVDDELAEHPVAMAVRYLRRLHYRARWLTPSEVLGALVTDRRMLEVATTHGTGPVPRSRDAWRRLRFVVDQARAWSEVEHGGLRDYLGWAERQGDESSRVAEAVLPETDTDAVRVMTVHAAKGQEFPMVVLSGMNSAPRTPRGVQLLWPRDGGYSVRLTKSVQTNDFEAVAPVDEQMDAHERKRLLYVATTRARDHLVVSVHRSEHSAVTTNAVLLAAAGATSNADDATEFTVPPKRDEAPTPPTVTTRPPEWSTWLEQLESVRAATRTPAAVSASGLEGTEPSIALGITDEMPGAAKDGRDLELPPWSKGRHGDAVGRAVHGVLQTVDLASGAGLDESVAAQCVAEGLTNAADVVHALARSALSSDVVRHAATRPHWRETYAGTTQDDGTVLEGFIDLVYREDDGRYVVVDYKTDAVPADAIDSRVAYYRPQMSAYVALLAASGLTVSRSVMVFLTPHRTVERALRGEELVPFQATLGR